jgi:6-phosphogluconolactonase
MRHDSMRRREFITGLAMAALARPAAAQRRAASSSPPRIMYVGSFTGAGRGRGEGLSVFARGGVSDPWKLVQLVDSVADPSFLAIDRPHRFLYSAHGGGQQATSYTIDEVTGRLSVLNTQPTKGVNGVHLAIDATDRFMALANYATGTLIVLPIEKDGTLGPVSDLATLSGTPGPHRTEQTSSHPHHCPFDPTGRFVVVPDKGLDKVFVYRLETARGTLVEVASADSRAGSAPRHVDFHPTRPFAYVINELNSTLTTYRFEPEQQVLAPVQVLPTLPPTFTGNNSTAEVWVAPSGRFVYGSNRGHDSIVIFAVDDASGTLTPIAWEPTRGRTPRYFGFDPTGTHLYAANQNSDTVVIFRVDADTGRLTATGETVAVKSPSTIVFK